MLDIKGKLGLGSKDSKKLVSKFHVLVAGALSLVVIFLLVQMVQFVRIRHQLNFIDALEDNNAKVIEEMSVAKNYLSNFGGDLNQIREYLLLPTKDYNFEDLGAVAEGAEEVTGDDLSTLVYTFIDSLGSYEETKALYEANLVGVKEFLVDGVWGEKFLFVEGFKVYDDQLEGLEVLDLALDLDATFTIRTYGGELKLTDNKSFASVQTDLEFWLGDIGNLRNLVRRVNENRNFVMNSVLVNADFQSVLAEKGMGVSEENDMEAYYSYSLFNGDGTTVSELRLFKTGVIAGTMAIQTDSGSKDDWLELSADETGLTALLDVLKKIDARTATQKLLDEHADELKALMKDKAFAATLENAGFTMGEMEETESRLSFPILNAEGEVLRILYLDKVTGEVMIENPEGGVETLSAAIESLDVLGKKKLWIYPMPCLSMVA